MATQEKYPNRWVQLALGITCMATVANCQYGWTMFVAPMQDKYHWARTSIQLAFTIFVFFETWLVPVEGWLADKYGAKPVIIGGGVLAMLGWIGHSYAYDLTTLYASAVVTGLGAGAVYGTAVGNALKWFPDKRGLAAGATAAGFGGGAAITVIPISYWINVYGYESAFFVFGICQGIIICTCAFFMPHPKLPPDTKAIPRVVSTKKDFTPTQILRQPVFWIIYICFVGVASGGMVATSSFGPVARDYGLSRIPVTFMGATLPLLTMTISIYSICNGATRPICGYISDRLGRENVMLVVFVCEGFALLGMMMFGRDPLGFMIFAALVFAFWGEIFSLFPSMCADTFGVKNAAGNAGTLYTAKGTSSLLVPFAAAISAGGNWDRAFIFSAAVAITCACIAFFILKPIRRNFILASNAEVEAAAAAAAAKA